MEDSKNIAAQLENVRRKLGETIIGQPDAIETIMGAIERFRAGLHDDKRPLGCFVFIGPSGCGKTYTVETLAQLTQPSDAFVRIDCSEFQLDHEVAKLFGSPPGYVGHESGSMLTKQISAIQNPEKGFILLLDEVEKANPRFFDAWLQVLDSGRMTDSKGKKLDFSRALIFMTSNVGAHHYSKDSTVGFRDNKENVINIQAAVTRDVKKTFKPEFINRLTGTVFFTPLTREQQGKILNNLFNDLNLRLTKHLVRVTVSEEANNHLISVGFSPEYGARELKRTLIKLVEQPLAHKLISKEIGSDSHIELCYNNLDGLTFHYLGEYPILQEDTMYYS